jgi:hypothetical protein
MRKGPQFSDIPQACNCGNEELPFKVPVSALQERIFPALPGTS